MSVSTEYRWPTKLKKFGIEDTFLKILVAKYENEIPWQSQVRNEKDLQVFVAEEMLPRQWERLAFPVKPRVRHCYVSVREVDLDLAIASDNSLSKEEIEILALIREDDGEIVAKQALVQIINERKQLAFAKWMDFLGSSYSTEAAFSVLLLRPLLEMSAMGVRRVIIPPSDNVIDWLYRRIKGGQVLPSENIAQIYARKLAIGSQKVVDNGWQYIPFGIENAAKLAAACVGSGWCVGSHDWAARYLEHSAFYILRDAGKPVVALRTSQDVSKVVECQGRNNSNPGAWFVDIDLFIRTQNLQLCSREWECDLALHAAGDLSEKPAVWWVKRLQYWPFAKQLVPPGKLPAEWHCELSDIAPYLGFPGAHALLQREGLVLDVAAWVEIVEVDPTRYSNVPVEYREHERILSACKTAFLARAYDGEMTLNDLSALPEFVRTDAEVSSVIQHYFPEEIRQRIRKRPSTASERYNLFDLAKALPLSAHDPASLAIEHAVNCLLSNETSNFSDAIFPESLRLRDDFMSIKQQAWFEAIQAQPPLWFALPDDLKNQTQFTLSKSEVLRIDIAAWEVKVKEKPWLLTQAKGVPKTIRHHSRILDAYLEGWLPLLAETPWKMWLRRGLGRRVYASYGILENERVFAALVQGWKGYRGNLYSAWMSASLRMRQMPVMQYSALMSVGDDARAAYVGPQVRRTFENIVALVAAGTPTHVLTPLEIKVKQRLQMMEFSHE